LLIVDCFFIFAILWGIRFDDGFFTCAVLLVVMKIDANSCASLKEVIPFLFAASSHP